MWFFEQRKTFGALGIAVIFLVQGMSGCTSGGADTDIPGIPEDTGWPDTDTGVPVIPNETGQGSELDLIPEHWLYTYQEGEWRLSPTGGPYTSMVGHLDVLELVDYRRPEPDTGDSDTGLPWDTGEDNPIQCQVAFSLIGAPSEQSCAECLFVLDVEFNVVSGNPMDCLDPDLPADLDVWTMGFVEDSNEILFDFYGSGIWLPWYTATIEGDKVVLDYTNRRGLSLEEEE